MLARWLLACTLPLSGACGPALPVVPLPPARPAPEFHLEAPTGTVAWRGADALESAAISLPAAEPSTFDGVMPLPDGWTQLDAARGRLRTWSHPLPFHTDMPRPNYAPMGARLLRGEQEIPYINDIGDLRGGGWFVDKGDIHLLTMESPLAWTTPPVLHAPELAARERRRRWTDPGASAADFVRTEVTTDRVTRPGLHLPSGGSIRFELAIPPEATLTWGAALLEDLLVRDAPPAGVRAKVSIDGRAVAEASVAAAWQPGTLDLAPWAGRTVSLELAAEAMAPGEEGHLVFTTPTVHVRTARPVRRIVVIGIDTLRQDSLKTSGYSRQTAPELDAWASQFVVYDNAWAPAPRTRPSFRAALTGRYPLAAIHAPTLAERLLPLGFRTAGVVANVHLVPRFGFNSGFEHWYYENGARAADQLDRGLAWLRGHAEEDSFLFVHLMDPHTWYNAPSPFGERFQKGTRPARVPEVFDRWQVYQLMRRPGFGDAERAWIRAAYDGEIAYLGHAISRFLMELDALPGETLTVVHSDHGEEFWDHDGFEHNHTLYDELVRAMLWIRTPGGWGGGPHRIADPVGLIDIVPTVMDLVGQPSTDTDGVSLRPTLAPGGALAARPLMLGHLMFGKERWGVVADGFKYILHTTSGQEELYDLGEDPRERDDLAAGAPPERLAAMRAAMERASGWPVRRGWRLTLLRPAAFSIAFEGPILGAGILDPEAGRETRANLEWGETPEVEVAEVGRVRVAAERMSFAPGPDAYGETVWIACDGPCPPAILTSGPAAGVPLGSGALKLGSLALEAREGTLVLPTTTERDALNASLPAGAPEPGQMQALEELGYIEPD